MGSWNDMTVGREPGDDYERVSEQLFKELFPSLQAAINDDAV